MPGAFHPSRPRRRPSDFADADAPDERVDPPGSRRRLEAAARARADERASADLSHGEPRDGEPTHGGRPAARHARRRRRSRSRHGRSLVGIAALALLVVSLGGGFALLQLVSRPQPEPTAAGRDAGTAPSVLAFGAATTETVGPAALATTAGAAPAIPVPTPAGPREVQSAARVLEATYTVEPGDTLGAIATRHNTTVERLQAFNRLADPRMLSIGQKLIVPPPL